MTSTKRRLASLASASALIATLAVAAAPGAAFAAKPPVGPPPQPPTYAYFNGFEQDTDVMTQDNNIDTMPMFNVTRVNPKQTTGIKAAASGKWYAKADVDAYAFTRYGGYSGIFGNGYTTSVDILLDTSKAVGGNRQFDWDSAISNSAGGYGRDFIFSVGEKPSVPGSFIMSASNNAPSNPSGGSDPLTVSKSGWYTFKHEFKSADGMLSVDMSVIFQGKVLKTWTLSTDPIGTVGGNRYGWLVDNGFAGLELDNVTRVQN